MAAPPLLLTMGDPAGIGPELALKAWTARHDALPPFAYVGDADDLSAQARTLGLNVPVEQTLAGDAAAVFGKALPVIHAPLAAQNTPGKGEPNNATAIIGAIETAVQAVHAGTASGVVTNPIHKASLLAAGFKHAGHTGFLGEIATRLWQRPAMPVMMLAAKELRVVPATVHIALADVPAALSTDLLVDICQIVVTDLSVRFGIPRPHLAISALNPHAGEDGAMGSEEETVIAPAIARLKNGGVNVSGPWPADAMFRAEAREHYDAAICMYHDQALIPIKTIAFERAVNVTLGLPFIRTSPDHGTAYDIAGTGKANPQSLIEAIKLAGSLAARAARRG